MPELELSAGVVDYDDSGGPGPVLVLLGGLVMDGSVWDPVVSELRGDHRCIVPTLPLGAHRRPMRGGHLRCQPQSGTSLTRIGG